MTNQEYFTRYLSKFNISKEDVEIILINQNVNFEANVDVKQAKKALYNEFSSILPVANVSEGGMSVSWNLEAIKIWYASLANEIGEENILLKKDDAITDMSYLM